MPPVAIGFLHSLDAIGRMFLVALVGYALAKRKVLTEEAVNGLTRLMIDAVIPCALCMNMLRGFGADALPLVSPILLLPPLWMALSAAASLAIFWLWPAESKAADRSCAALAAVPNSFYLPLPLALALTPADQHVMVAMLVGVAVLAINPIQWTMGTYLVRGSGGEWSDWRGALSATLSGPVIGVTSGALLSLVPGLSEAARGTGGPGAARFVFGAMGFLGQAMPPMAMILVGALVARCSIGHALTARHLVVVMGARFVAVPLAVLLLLKSGALPILHPTVKLVLILEAASPPAMNLALAAKRFGGPWEVLSAIQLVTSLAALIVLPLWIALSG